MARLKYPLDLNENFTDYVTFEHFPYTTNRAIAGGQVNPSGRRVDGTTRTPPGGGSGRNGITLYVPNSIPDMGYSNQWRADTAAGERGNIARNIAGAATSIGIPDGGPDKSIQRLIEAAGAALSADGAGSGVSALRQGIIEGIATRLNQNPNSILALSTGKILNPNVELVYQGPQLRDFSFSFIMSPKSQAEANAIKDIIYEFKTWSAPSVQDANGGMLKIPDVWLVRYNGAFSRNSHPFKKAALKAVNVSYNGGLNTHMTFDSGDPVVVGIRLDFVEVDYILREDHKRAKAAGFRGGF